MSTAWATCIWDAQAVFLYCNSVVMHSVNLRRVMIFTHMACTASYAGCASNFFTRKERTIMTDLQKELSGNSYPGRGIVIGTSADGKYAVCAYFIMGRSVNSRNRVFVTDGTGIRTQAFDPSKMEDPSLIIYAPVRTYGFYTIVTNCDQTDTIYDGLSTGKTFEESLRSREFEPDAPNYTPRISGLMHVITGKYDYALSILKSDHGDPSNCQRFTYSYENPKAGEGYFIHTYMGDGNPLPSYEGEPTLVNIEGDIDTFTENVWNALNEDNKVSLFTRFINIATGEYETRIVNKNKD
jgi:IMP cyclohydrolase